MATYDTSTGDVFYYWVKEPTTSYTGTATESIWYNWTSDSDHHTTSSTNDSIWELWQTDNSNYYNKVRLVKNSAPIFTSPKRSIEEERAIKAQRVINKKWRDIRIAEEKKRKKQAELTAQQLLEDLIGEEELAFYRETGRLVVKGRKHDYVIQKGRGVYKVEKDKIKDLCIHLESRYSFPETDNVIGLKLLIEADESKFLKVANDNGEVYDSGVKTRVLELVERAA